MNNVNTGLFVDKFYEMDPATEDLIGRGDQLKNGMIVLIEDSMVRVDPASIGDNVSGKYELERARENNRWCTVSELHIQKRFEQDKYGDNIGEGSPLISFVAIYGDGTKKKRRYDASYAWIVKLIPDVDFIMTAFNDAYCRPYGPLTERDMSYWGWD